jgi:hypothetical protein
MTLSVPNYLIAADIQDDSIRYLWDDWNLDQAEEPIDEALVARLVRISQRAVLAFACGSAEWIVYRFAQLQDDPNPWNYLEAAWAMIIHSKYCGEGSAVGWQEYSTEGWEGPIKGPIRRSLALLESEIQELAWHGKNNLAEYSAYIASIAANISTLAVHVMTDPSSYKRWCEQVLERFESLYPLNPEDPLGDVVPRKAVDPEFDFDVAQTEALTNEFLASLDYHSNIFLSPPEGMLEYFEDDLDPFTGMPYQFDIERDRSDRIKV